HGLGGAECRETAVGGEGNVIDLAAGFDAVDFTGRLQVLADDQLGRGEQGAPAIRGDGNLGHILEPADPAPSSAVQVRDGHPAAGKDPQDSVAIREYGQAGQEILERNDLDGLSLPEVPDADRVVGVDGHDTSAVGTQGNALDLGAGLLFEL